MILRISLARQRSRQPVLDEEDDDDEQPMQQPLQLEGQQIAGDVAAAGAAASAALPSLGSRDSAAPAAVGRAATLRFAERPPKAARTLTFVMSSDPSMRFTRTISSSAVVDDEALSAEEETALPRLPVICIRRFPPSLSEQAQEEQEQNLYVPRRAMYVRGRTFAVATGSGGGTAGAAVFSASTKSFFGKPSSSISERARRLALRRAAQKLEDRAVGGAEQQDGGEEVEEEGTDGEEEAADPRRRGGGSRLAHRPAVGARHVRPSARSVGFRLPEQPARENSMSSRMASILGLDLEQLLSSPTLPTAPPSAVLSTACIAPVSSPAVRSRTAAFPPGIDAAASALSFNGVGSAGAANSLPVLETGAFTISNNNNNGSSSMVVPSLSVVSPTVPSASGGPVTAPPVLKNVESWSSFGAVGLRASSSTGNLVSSASFGNLQASGAAAAGDPWQQFKSKVAATSKPLSRPPSMVFGVAQTHGMASAASASSSKAAVDAGPSLAATTSNELTSRMLLAQEIQQFSATSGSNVDLMAKLLRKQP